MLTLNAEELEFIKRYRALQSGSVTLYKNNGVYDGGEVKERLPKVIRLDPVMNRMQAENKT